MNPNRTPYGPKRSIPTISVVMPTYNRAPTLRNVVDRVLEQKTQDRFTFEFIVVDNGSKDETWDILQEYGERVLSIREDRPGETFARNSGIKASSGDWIALIDDDEFADPGWLLGLLDFALRQGVPVVAGSIFLDISPGLRESLGRYCLTILSERAGESPLKFEGMNVPSCGSVLLSREVFDTIGLFNEEMTIASDSEFFIRAREAGFEMWRTHESIVFHLFPQSRLTPEFIISRAQWQGAHFVLLESKGSKARAIFLGATRLFSALLIHPPQLIYCLLRKQNWQAVGHRARLWRAFACAKAALSVVAPSWMSAKDFLDAFSNEARERKGTLSPPSFPLVGNLFNLIRSRFSLGFRPREICHEVEGIKFRFKISSPEAEDWYVTGVGGRSHRKDLAFWLSHLVQPKDIVFDVGGFQGFTTLFFAKSLGSKGRVITFELNSENASIIEQNVVLNSLNNVKVENCAVGRESGEVQFLKRPNAAVLPHRKSWFSMAQAWVFGTESVHQIALDDYCEEHQVWPDVLKVDVEGYEATLLAGATKLLKRKPRLAIELHPALLKRRGESIESVLAFLDPTVYQFWIQWSETSTPVLYDGSPVTRRLQFFALPK